MHTSYSSLIAAHCTDFHLDKSIIPHLSDYFILHWSSDWFYKQAKNDLTTLQYDDNIYILNTAELDITFKGQLRLSFRKLLNAPFGFCLVRPIIL